MSLWCNENRVSSFCAITLSSALTKVGLDARFFLSSIIVLLLGDGSAVAVAGVLLLIICSGVASLKCISFALTAYVDASLLLYVAGGLSS